MEAELLVPEVMDALLLRGYDRALNLASALAAKSPEALDEGSLALVSSSVAKIPAKPAEKEPAAEEEPAEATAEEEKDEEEAEESGIEGLGALFG